MNATEAAEQKQNSGNQPTKLDNRYGKIGISAVAGAVQHKPEQRPAAESRFVPADSD